MPPEPNCPPSYAEQYGDERYNPTLPQCNHLTLHFNGSRLRLRSPQQASVTSSRASYVTAPISKEYPAVSGKPLESGDFDYSPARQRMQNVGPIPEGVYWITPSELWENAIHKVLAPRSAWGFYRISIHPFTTTNTYCRGGFFLHGGVSEGSAGCIDLTSHMTPFVADLRGMIGSQMNCQIHLTVAYSSDAGRGA